MRRLFDWDTPHPNPSLGGGGGALREKRRKGEGRKENPIHGINPNVARYIFPFRGESAAWGDDGAHSVPSRRPLSDGREQAAVWAGQVRGQDRGR